MRRIATLVTPVDGIHRVMLYADDRGVVLFLYDSLDDRACTADEWYESVNAAEATCREAYGITTWTEIPDPEPGCFHDRIAPLRRA